MKWRGTSKIYKNAHESSGPTLAAAAFHPGILLQIFSQLVSSAEFKNVNLCDSIRCCHSSRCSEEDLQEVKKYKPTKTKEEMVNFDLNILGLEAREMAFFAVQFFNDMWVVFYCD